MEGNSQPSMNGQTRKFLSKFIRNIRKGPPKGVGEQRGAARQPFLANLTYYAISPKTGRIVRSRPHRAYSLDISVSGVRILTRSLPNCSEIALVIEHNLSEAIALRGKIVRKALHPNGYFEIAVAFLEQIEYPFKDPGNGKRR